MRMTALLLSMTLCGSAAAQAWQPDFNASAFKGPASGPANEVLVLGSPICRNCRTPSRPPA